MITRSKLVFALLLTFVSTQLVWAEKINDIHAQGYVTDLAGVIDPATRQRIELLGAEVEQKTGAQIAVVTVNSLEGQTREDYAADLYKHLGIGSKKNSNGVLILIAPKDRQYKIEVGYGLEPVINDARAGDVGREMVPDLRKGDYSAAALTGATDVAQYIAAEAGVTLSGLPKMRPRPPTKHEAPWWLPFALFFGFFLLVRALARAGRRGGGPRAGGGGMGSALPWLLMGNAMGRSGSWGGGWGGSSSGWGGGGGGGFGGFGGGMSGGGGAGGSW